MWEWYQQDCVWSWGFMFYCAFHLALHRKKGTLLLERHFLTKPSRKKQGQESCPRAKWMLGLCQTYVKLMLLFGCFAVWQDTLWQLQMCSEESWLILSVGKSKSGGASCPCRILISRYWHCHIELSHIYCLLLLSSVLHRVFVQKTVPWIQQDVFL